MMTLDGRRMNNMDADSKVVHMRLEAWGVWAKQNQGAWPTVSIIGRLMDAGPTGAAQVNRAPVSMPENIALTDAAVARLGKLHQGVIVTYYTNWEPIEVMARRHRIGVRQFQNLLKQARWSLTGLIGPGCAL